MVNIFQASARDYSGGRRVFVELMDQRSQWMFSIESDFYLHHRHCQLLATEEQRLKGLLQWLQSSEKKAKSIVQIQSIVSLQLNVAAQVYILLLLVVLTLKFQITKGNKLMLWPSQSLDLNCQLSRTGVEDFVPYIYSPYISYFIIFTNLIS